MAELFEQYKQQLIEDPQNTVPRRYQPPHPVVTATKPNAGVAAVEDQSVVKEEQAMVPESVAKTSTPSNGKSRGGGGLSAAKDKKQTFPDADLLLAVAALSGIPSLVCSRCDQQVLHFYFLCFFCFIIADLIDFAFAVL